MITYLLTMYVLINTQQFIIYSIVFHKHLIFNDTIGCTKFLILQKKRDKIWQISRAFDSSMVHLLV